MVKILREIFSDESGLISSKRIAGMLCVLALIIALVGNTFYPKDITPSSRLIDAVALFAFGALGLTSIDKFTKIKNRK
jgi:hypothetical protein